MPLDDAEPAATLTALPIALDFEPMEAKLATELPEEPGWAFEPKWDGFRCLAFKAGSDVALVAKSGKPLTRYFPEMVAAVAALPADRFVLDGELTIPVDGLPDFEALQMRLHPAASRIAKLSVETPSKLVLFDALAIGDEVLAQAPLSERRAALERLVEGWGSNVSFGLSPVTADRAEAQGWLEARAGGRDGVVAKRLDEPYRPGERAMIKVKPLRTADCVVGGFRYEKDGPFVASLLLGLYDEADRLNHVGFTATISHAEREELTRKLEALVEPPGFTGKAPGGPSRWTTERTAEWSPLKPELVVEVRYDHVTGDRFRHGTKLLRWRPDKAPRQCRMEQIR